MCILFKKCLQKFPPVTRLIKLVDGNGPFKPLVDNKFMNDFPAHVLNEK